MRRISESSASATATRRSRALERRLHRRLGEVWKPGGRLPPIEKLARDMGVGITNMRRAAKSLADRGLLIARPGAGTFVVPSLVAAPDGVASQGDSVDTPLAGKIVHVLIGAQSTDDPAGARRLDRASELRLRGFERGIGVSADARHLIRVPGYDCFPGTLAAAAYVRLDAPPPLIFAACDELASRRLYPHRNQEPRGITYEHSCHGNA